MPRNKRGAIAAGVAFAVVFAVFGAAPAFSGVNVNVNIGPPAVVVAEPPEMVVVPETMVYFAPGVSVDLLFFDGFWWTPKEGRWFRARGYDGPWTIVPARGVPRAIGGLPRGYRSAYGHGDHVPYGQLKKHWRHREIERREHRGEWKHYKGDRKEARREMKEREKDHKREYKEHKREHGEREREHGRGR